jgi:hypothetical protein
MKRIIRLTESDLTKIVKRVINEQDNNPLAFATDPNNMDYAGFNKSSKPLPDEIDLEVKNKTNGTTEIYKVRVEIDKTMGTNGEHYVLWNFKDQVKNISIGDIFTLNFVLPFKVRSINLKGGKDEIYYTDINRSSNEETPIILSCEKKKDSNYTFELSDDKQPIAWMKVVFDYYSLNNKVQESYRRRY